ncbi:hypothetical protein HUU40_22190 [candidate division KSB1 bacterium]|nr:hypothetical protein [candidate division KSB1 bacterium]
MKKNATRQVTFEGGLVPSPALFEGERILGTINAGLWDIGLFGFLLRHQERLVVTTHRIFQFSRQLTSASLRALELSKVEAVDVGSKFYPVQFFFGLIIFCTGVAYVNFFLLKLVSAVIGGFIMYAARKKVFHVSAAGSRNAVTLPLTRIKVEESKSFIDLVCGAMRNLQKAAPVPAHASLQTPVETLNSGLKSFTPAPEILADDEVFYTDIVDKKPQTSFDVKKPLHRPPEREQRHATPFTEQPVLFSNQPTSSSARLNLESICAAGMIAAFFLPWAQIFGFSASGYNLGKLGSYANLAWLIPGMSVAVIALRLAGKSIKIAALITGLMPFVGLLYGVSKIGDKLFHVVGVGVYLTLALGLILILASLKASKDFRGTTQ